jgi:hypothetical protein
MHDVRPMPVSEDFFTGQIQIHYGEPAKLIAQAIDPVFETPTETIERGAFAMLLALRTLLPDDVPPSRASNAWNSRSANPSQATFKTCWTRTLLQ